MAFKRVTLKDISKAVGLSVPVVSRIMNGRETYCSERKIRAVKETAAALGYRSNVGYRIMIGSGTNIVAVLFSQRRHIYFPHINQLYMHLNSELRRRGFASYCTVLELSMTVEEQLAALRELDDLGCRSYIFIGYPTGYAELQAFLESRARTFICMNNGDAPRRLLTDEAGLCAKCMTDWMQHGLTNFRYVTNREHFDRFIIPLIPPEYRDVCRKNLLPWTGSTGVPDDDPDAENFRIGYRLIRRVLAEDPKLQAALFGNDYSALGAARAVIEAGRHDVELCGMNRTIASKYAFYPLRTGVFDMKECAKKLVEHMDGKEPLEIVIPGELVQCDVMKISEIEPASAASPGTIK